MSYHRIPNSSLRVLRDGVGKSGQMPELDIVAVHGLNPMSRSDHAESTWTCEDGTCWLTHPNFLPKKLPKARILCYRYNSAIFCGGSSIFDQAKDLVKRLHRKRSGVHGYLRRPLLFIAHSLGGLLVKAALVAAVIAEGDVYRDLATCPKGLATFGTPHRGSIFASLLGFIQDFLKPFETLDVLMGDQPTLPEGYLDILRQGDIAAYIIGVQFFDCYRSAIPITSFYEMKGLIGSLGKIVRKKSATLKDDRQKANHRERRVGLNADHDSMVKLSRADRGIGRAVLVEIKRLADKVLESGPTSGLASGSTETNTDGGASSPSESTAASWEEGSVKYFGDDGVDIEMREDESIDSSDDGVDTEMRDDESIESKDDGVDTEMLEDEFIDGPKFGSTSYPRRGTVSYTCAKARQRDPFNTHAMPESAKRPNIGHTQWGPQTIPTPPFCCVDCVLSKTRQCPSHCKDCQKKRSYRPPKLSYPSKSFNKLRTIMDEADLCQQHKKQLSKTRDQRGPQGFIWPRGQALFDSVPSSASPQHKFQMPAANARPAFTTPQSLSQHGSRVRSPTPTPPSRHSQMEEEEESARRSGGNKKVRKMHQDHSEPSNAHTPRWESGIPAQGSRKSQRLNRDRRDLSPKQPPKQQPPTAIKATTSTKTSAKLPENTPILNNLRSQMQRGNGGQPLRGNPGPNPRRGPGR